MDRLLVPLVVLFLLLPGRVAAITCFLRSGQVHETGQPCHPEKEQSHCCGQDGHVCLSNSLCFDYDQNHVIEGSCTDETWTTDACSHYCENTLLSNYGDIRQCDGTNDFWTCGQDVSDCSRNFTVPNGYVDDKREGSHSVYSNIPTAVAASFAPSAATATVSITVTASSGSDAGSSKNCSETTVGLGAGLGVGIPLLIAVALSQVFLWRANRKLRRLNQVGRHQHQHQHQPLRDLDTSDYRAEIDGRNIHEAPYQK